MCNCLKLIIIVLSLCSCSNEKENTPIEDKPVIHYDKYSLELDKNYNIFKVAFSSEITNGFSMEYYYYRDSIVKTERTIPGNSEVTTYYLNSRGLADSCKTIFAYNPAIRTFFYYDSTGYLKTSIQKGGYGTTTSYEYRNGNRISASFNPKLPPGIYSITYYYDSSVNLINIETFTGPWLGVLNKNLVIKKGELTIDGGIELTYNYILNSRGLPEKRTRIQRMYNQETTIITSFEYKITE